MKKLIIEVRINEYNTRDDNPNVPWTKQEIVRDALDCREAGASIVHFHARQNDGAPSHTYESYAEIVQGIRECSDILTHPTLGYVTLNASASERMANITRLVADGIAPDLAPMDMGSTNVSMLDQAGNYLAESEERVYQNSTATLHYFADKLRQHKVKPYLTAWNIAHLRETEQFLRQGWLSGPLFLCFVCTDHHCLGGHPGTTKGLQAFIDFLPVAYQLEWGVCNYGGSLMPIAAQAIAQGGHISIGLGDWHYKELGQPTNADLVKKIVELARALGREIATPLEARQMLKMPS